MIAIHRGAFEYDWRTRLHQPLTVVGETMTWGEALRLAQRLVRDPSSAVGAELAGWDYPLGYEGLALMNLFDLMHEIAWAQGGGKGPRPKKYPRPWPDRSRRVTRATVSQEEVLAALRMAGHTALPPLVTA